MSEDSLGDSNAQNTSQDESEIEEQDKGESQETLIRGNSIENVNRSTPNPINFEDVLNQLLQRQESFLSSFTNRQQQVEESLDRFIKYQTDSNEQFRKEVQRNDHFENKLDELRSHLKKNQTVGGDEDPAIIYNTASDREAGDIAAAPSLVKLRDSGGFSLERPSLDLNSGLYLGTLTDESSRQCARSLEGATHASIGTRSGVGNKEYRVLNNKGYEVPDKTRKVLEEERRILEEQRRLFEDERRNFEGTGVRPKRVTYRRNEQEAEGAHSLNYLSLNQGDYSSDEEVTFRNAPRKQDRLEPKLTSNSRMLDPSNVRSCSNLEFSVAGVTRNWPDQSDRPRHHPVFALEGRTVDSSHVTNEASGWATTLASKFSFPTRNENFSTKNDSSQFSLKHDESAGLPLGQSADVYLPNTLHSFELNRNKSENTSVIYSTPSMFARASELSQPCLSSVVHERVKEPISVMSTPDHYHPSSKQFKSSATEKATKGPWDQTDWNALARSELQTAVNIADNLNKNKAKNVIMFIGDGMGISTLSSARLYNAENRNLQQTNIYLAWEKFPHVGLSRTYNVDRSTPDSAGTATAYLCGVKANYETIGVNDKVPFDSCTAIAGNTVRSIAKHSIAANKWTGVVTTTRITHASPAGAYAHVANRDWEAFVPTSVPNYDQCDDIAKQLITDPENQKTRVILGGGLKMFLPNNETGLRTDGRNLINEWIQTRTSKGESHQYVQNKAHFDAVDVSTTDYLFGLFSEDHMDYEADRIKVNPIQQPSLAEMTEKAIRLLSRSPNGYFLFVEGGRIDHSHHEASAFKALNDTIALSDAVQKAIDLTNTADTTIVVTSDHSHVFTFGGYASFQQSVLDFSDGPEAFDDKPYLQLNYGNGPSYLYHRMNGTTEVPRKNLSDVDVKDPEFRQDTGIFIGSETHGGEDVGIFASGPLSHLIHGNHEQSYISHMMMYASCVGDYTSESHCTAANSAVDPGSGPLSPFNFLHVVCIMLGLLILV